MTPEITSERWIIRYEPRQYELTYPALWFLVKADGDILLKGVILLVMYKKIESWFDLRLNFLGS